MRGDAGLMAPPDPADRDGSLQRRQEPQPGHRGRHRRNLEHRDAERCLERGVDFRRAAEAEHRREADRLRVAQQRLHPGDRPRARFPRLEGTGEVGGVELGRGFGTGGIRSPVRDPASDRPASPRSGGH
jgi:hypothetical protein